METQSWHTGYFNLKTSALKPQISDVSTKRHCFTTCPDFSCCKIGVTSSKLLTHRADPKAQDELSTVKENRLRADSPDLTHFQDKSFKTENKGPKSPPQLNNLIIGEK